MQRKNKKLSSHLIKYEVAYLLPPQYVRESSFIQEIIQGIKFLGSFSASS